MRYSNGDCPGTYALGTVTDRSGAPIAGVRLSLVDEYGNAATAVTKPGPGDTGRYDFPMGGPPRRFYMTVVDEGGRALSPPRRDPPRSPAAGGQRLPLGGLAAQLSRVRAAVRPHL